MNICSVQRDWTSIKEYRLNNFFSVFLLKILLWLRGWGRIFCNILPPSVASLYSSKNSSIAFLITCACAVPVAAHFSLNASAISFGTRTIIEPYTRLLYRFFTADEVFVFLFSAILFTSKTILPLERRRAIPLHRRKYPSELCILRISRRFYRTAPSIRGAL